MRSALKAVACLTATTIFVDANAILTWSRVAHKDAPCRPIRNQLPGSPLK